MKEFLESSKTLNEAVEEIKGFSGVRDIRAHKPPEFFGFHCEVLFDWGQVFSLSFWDCRQDWWDICVAREVPPHYTTTSNGLLKNYNEALCGACPETLNTGIAKLCPNCEACLSAISRRSTGTYIGPPDAHAEIETKLRKVAINPRSEVDPVHQGMGAILLVDVYHVLVTTEIPSFESLKEASDQWLTDGPGRINSLI